MTQLMCWIKRDERRGSSRAQSYRFIENCGERRSMTFQFRLERQVIVISGRQLRDTLRQRPKSRPGFSHSYKFFSASRIYPSDTGSIFRNGINIGVITGYKNFYDFNKFFLNSHIRRFAKVNRLVSLISDFYPLKSVSSLSHSLLKCQRKHILCASQILYVYYNIRAKKISRRSSSCINMSVTYSQMIIAYYSLSFFLQY